MSKKFFKTIAIAIVVCILGPTDFAFANDSYHTKLSELANKLPYSISEQKLDNLIEKISRYHHWTKEKTIQAEIALLQNPNSAENYQDRSSGQGDKRLPAARNRGDFYFTPAGMHGHTGIYLYKNTIVEAPGIGKVVEEKPISNVYVSSGAILRSVNTSQANRTKAAERSRTYIGRGYNAYFFQGNKNDWGGMHCAQLVWASYKYGAGIDIDDGNDDIVWPRDLQHTSKATTYQTIR